MGRGKTVVVGGVGSRNCSNSRYLHAGTVVVVGICMQELFGAGVVSGRNYYQWELV